jgi:hypothetical protein
MQEVEVAAELRDRMETAQPAQQEMVRAKEVVEEAQMEDQQHQEQQEATID